MHVYETLKHTNWECKYHVVFIPKCRRKTLYGQLRRDLGPVFRDLAGQKECEVIQGHLDAGSRPHAHLDSTETFGVASDGVYQREECDPHCSGLCGAAEKFRRSAFLGARILGIDGR